MTLVGFDYGSSMVFLSKLSKLVSSKERRDDICMIEVLHRCQLNRKTEHRLSKVSSSGENHDILSRNGKLGIDTMIE